MSKFDAFNISAEQSSQLAVNSGASYWLVSSDGRVSSFGKPYWGGPTVASKTIGMYVGHSERGYALVGPNDWLKFGPEAPDEPAWLGEGDVHRIKSTAEGCWALLTDGSVHDPRGEQHKPTSSGSYIDFAISENGVIWLDGNGDLSGAETRASSNDAAAISVNICDGEVLVVHKDGSIVGPNAMPDRSLTDHLVDDVICATSKGAGMWLVTANGTVYGWGEAQHGGNLHAPRANESVIALYV